MAGHIRVAQALGLSLRQIAPLLAQEQAGDFDSARSLAILRERRESLASKAEELGRLVAYLDAKIAWVNNGSAGTSPNINDFAT
jgi:DNA-binding transcriptional MerR regulator